VRQAATCQVVLLDLFFDHQDGGDMSLQKVSWLSPTTRRYIPEDRNVQKHCYENLNSCKPRFNQKHVSRIFMFLVLCTIGSKLVLSVRFAATAPTILNHSLPFHLYTLQHVCRHQCLQMYSDLQHRYCASVFFWEQSWKSTNNTANADMWSYYSETEPFFPLAHQTSTMPLRHRST
jgi:hypothetical protein